MAHPASDAPTLTAPTGGAATDRFGPTFIWEPLPGSPTYRLQIAADAAFSDVRVDTLVGTTDRLTLFDVLPVGAVLYWRLQAGSGPAWSPAEAFRVGGGATPVAGAAPAAPAVAAVAANTSTRASRAALQVPYRTGTTSGREVLAFLGMMLFTIVLLALLIASVPGL